MATSLPDDDRHNPLAESLRRAVDAAVASPEVSRALDRALAGPLPEQLVEAMIRNQVLERMTVTVADAGEFQRLVTEALESSRTQRITDAVLASDALQHTLRELVSSPALRDAIARQSAGLTQEVASSVRAAAERMDDRAQRLVRRSSSDEPRQFAGIVTRAIAMVLDTFATLALYLVIAGSAALVGTLVGGLRPTWLVGVLLASGWALLAGTYFIVFWTTAGQTPGMRLFRMHMRRAGGDRLSLPRATVRLIGVVLSVIPMFAGFVPIVFTTRRRGLADLLADTIVTRDDRWRESAERAS